MILDKGLVTFTQWLVFCINILKHELSLQAMIYMENRSFH